MPFEKTPKKWSFFSPYLTLADEATANVDPENEKELVEAIGELTHDKTVSMVTHRLKTVRGADQILVVDGGKIVRCVCFYRRGL